MQTLRRPLAPTAATEPSTQRSAAHRSGMPAVLAGLLITILLLPSGCGTSPDRSVRLQAVSAPASSMRPSASTNTVPAAPTQAPASIELNTSPADGEEWRSLEAWAADRSGVSVQRLLGAGQLTYEVTGPTGSMRLTAQQASALSRGILVSLGYPPFALNDSLWIHRADLEKNVQPLVQASRATLAGAPIIMIDPGHGGDNPGARNTADGSHEKNLTLDWGLRLAPLLKAQGWRVHLTRTNDTTVTLTNRVLAAETCGAALFLSLHFNSTAGRLDTSGIETYCLTPRGLPSTITRDYEDDPNLEFINNTFDEANLRLALQLQDTIVKHCQATDRGVRRARFTTVLRGQRCPAALIEGGYLSHPREAGRIASPDYRQSLAEAVARAIGPAPPLVASTPHPQPHP